MSRWLPSVRTPWADVCQLFEEGEFSSLRGIPEIAPAIMRALQAMKFDNATLAKMIATTLNPYWAEQTDRASVGAKMPGEKELDDWVSEMLIEPGVLNVLPFGVKVTQAAPAEVGNTYEPFMKMEQRYKAAVMGVMYQEMTGDWTDFNDRAHRAASLALTRRINADRLNIEMKQARKHAKRFVDRCYLSGAWQPPKDDVPQREWYRHEWRWPAARYQNLFQEMNAWKLAVDSRFTSRSQAVAEVTGRDVRQVDREIAIDDARAAALAADQPAGAIIREEIAKDELEVAEQFALSDDDAVGLRKPVKSLSRSERRGQQKRRR
jgi:capsid protein